MSDKRFEITIVVNGQPVEVKVGLDEQIGEAVEDALKDSGNSGQPQSGGSCGTNPANLSIPARRSVDRALWQAPNYS